MTAEPLPSVALPDAIKDVAPNHWAKNQVAAAVDAGLFTPASADSFDPDSPATRGQVARGLAAMLVLRPEAVKVTLNSRLVPLKGEVMISESGREFRIVDNETVCGSGATVKTGPGGGAELRLPDGSGLKLEENTELTIKQAYGRTTIRSDGSAGTMVDSLKIGLPRGKVFGALASIYQKADTDRITVKEPAPNVVQNLRQTGKPELTPVQMPVNQALAQEVNQTGGLPWWKNPSGNRFRVEVDMPWGVAGIRGTFWMNQVGEDGQTTSVINGTVEVTSGGGTVTVNQGENTTISSPDGPPSPPALMSEEQQQDWLGVMDWVFERANEIQNLAPAVPAVSPEQKDDITRSYMESISGVTSPMVIETDPLDGEEGVSVDQTIGISFNEAVQAGDAYSRITVTDAAGKSVEVRKGLDGKTLTLEPVEDLGAGAPLSGAITLTFDIPVYDASGIPIKLTSGDSVLTITGRVADNQLNAPYTGLLPGRTYTVTIPAGRVQSQQYGTYNEELVWEFTTVIGGDN